MSINQTTMSFQITGKLVKSFETEQKTESFKSREFVIEITNGEYPQFVKFQCVQDKTAIVDGVNEGDQITVHFDLRGREWQGKYFTNLNAWRVEKGSQAPATPPPTPDEPDFPTTDAAPAAAVKADNDLPF